jgi:hypothetical protein
MHVGSSSTGDSSAGYSLLCFAAVRKMCGACCFNITVPQVECMLFLWSVAVLGTWVKVAFCCSASVTRQQ